MPKNKENKKSQSILTGGWFVDSPFKCLADVLKENGYSEDDEITVTDFHSTKTIKVKDV